MTAWREKAKPEGKGRDFRPVMPLECMEDIPAVGRRDSDGGFSVWGR